MFPRRSVFGLLLLVFGCHSQNGQQVQLPEWKPQIKQEGIVMQQPASEPREKQEVIVMQQPASEPREKQEGRLAAGGASGGGRSMTTGSGQLTSDDIQYVDHLRKAKREAAEKLRIKPANLRKFVNEGTPVTFVDLRPKAEFERSSVRLPGSIRTDPEELTGCLNCPRDRITVVYCCTPNEEISARAVTKLRELGFNEAYALEGGIPAWTAVGGQVDMK